MFERRCTGECRRSHGAGRETAAFLVAPDNDVDGPQATHPGRNDRRRGFERGNDAVRPIELPAVRLGVKMTAGQYGREASTRSLQTQEQIADRVTLRLEPDRSAPPRQQAPRGNIFFG